MCSRKSLNFRPQIRHLLFKAEEVDITFTNSAINHDDESNDTDNRNNYTLNVSVSEGEFYTSNLCEEGKEEENTTSDGN